MKSQVERNIDLVYGGGSIGLMGLVSQAVYDGGRHVLGYHWLSLSHLSLSLSLSGFIEFGFVLLQSDPQIPHAQRGNFTYLFIYFEAKKKCN